MDDFSGRTAFVTGGASGIGLGIARKLVAQGVKVVIADIRRDHLDQALSAFAEAGQADQVHGIELDVTDRTAFAAAERESSERFGGTDILVNNAGVGLEGPLREASYADWDFGIGVNLGGVINGLQSFLPGMRARGRGGHVVNTASLAGLTPMPSWMAIYATSKAAVIALSEAIRDDLATDGIGVSVLCPGPIKSNIHETIRNRPERFRQGSGFVASEERLSKRIVSSLWMEPATVGDMIVDAIRTNRLFVITHGEWRDIFNQRTQAILDAMPLDVNADLIQSLRNPATRPDS